MREGTVAARVELLRVLPASSLEEHTGPPSTSITGSKRTHVIPLAVDLILFMPSLARCQQ